jgi:integrative and conjugative element protein (TIGR02256 family)
MSPVRDVGTVAKRAFFRRPEAGRIAVAAEAVADMSRLRQTRCWSNEQGGMLLGRLLTQSDDVAIDVATLPDARDRASRFLFFRVRAPAQALVEKLWLESGGTCVYLGEWHTHPQRVPEPSSQDRANWKRIFTEARFDQDFLLFAIVGTDGFKIWEQRKSGLFTTHRETIDE